MARKAKRLGDEDLKRAIAATSIIPDIKPENVILGPRRADLIEDGALVDVTPTAREAGFTVPMALTQAAWARHVKVPEGDTSGQDERGRLWDVLWMAAFGARQNRKTNSNRITFEVISSANEDGKLKTAVTTKLDLVIEGGDNLEPVMTISLLGED